jgi:hypothetical protein
MYFTRRKDMIHVGSIVKVIDISGFTTEQLRISDFVYYDLLYKSETSDICLVFNINEEDEKFVDIVFENGFEICRVPRSVLIEADDEFFELTVMPREDPC